MKLKILIGLIVLAILLYIIVPLAIKASWIYKYDKT